MTDDERTLGQLVASMSNDVSALVRGELELAKAELRQSAVRAAKGSAMFGTAGFLGYVAFLLLSVAAALGLSALGLHPALGFLIVAVVYLILAAVLAFIGKRNLDRAGPPKRAVAELETTRESAKALLRRP